MNRFLSDLMAKLRSLGISERQACLRVGLNADTIRNMRRGSSPRLETVRLLAKEYGIAIDDAENLQPADEEDTPRPADLFDEFALIPVLDAKASAGTGAWNDDHPEILYKNAFRRDWLRRFSARTENLAVIRVAGDSMWQTLHDGDHVLIDSSVINYVRDGLYVLRYSDGDECMVKRLMRDPRTRTLTIRSDNPDYTSYDGVSDDDIHVIGRVLWLGRNIG